MKVRQPAFKNPEKNRPSSGIYRWEGIAMKHPEFFLCFRINFHLFCVKHFIFSPVLLSDDTLTFKVYVSAKLKV